MPILDWLESLSFDGGAGILIPAALFAGSVAFFGFVIFNLHRHMSLHNVLGIDLSGLRKRGGLLFWCLYLLAYVALYGAVFPFVAYLWFCVLVVLLAFLYNTKGPDELLLIAMAVLTAVRVTAYYDESLSRDIAKILPYGLLGIFLVNLGQFDYRESIELVKAAAAEREQAFYYWLFIAGQELALRVTQPAIIGVYGWLKGKASVQAGRVVARWREYREAKNTVGRD